MIYGIEGQFGSGKTTLCAYFASRIFNKSKSAIIRKELYNKKFGYEKVKRYFELLIESFLSKKIRTKEELLEERKKYFSTLGFGRTIIFSNIKFDASKICNYVYFEDRDFLSVLETIYYVNYAEKKLFGVYDELGNIYRRRRENFTKFYVFFDESTAIMNARNFIENKKEYKNLDMFIIQNRKMFMDLFIVGSDGEQNDKSLRRHVDWWFTVKKIPFSDWFPFLRDIGLVYTYQKDDEGNIKLVQYVGKDERGDRVVKNVPVIEFYGLLYKRKYRDYYDDLFVNVKDLKDGVYFDKYIYYLLGEKKENLELLPVNVKNSIIEKIFKK